MEKLTRIPIYKTGQSSEIQRLQGTSKGSHAILNHGYRAMSSEIGSSYIVLRDWSLLVWDQKIFWSQLLVLVPLDQLSREPSSRTMWHVAPDPGEKSVKSPGYWLRCHGRASNPRHHKISFRGPRLKPANTCR